MYNNKYIVSVLLFVVFGVATSQYVLFESYNSATCKGSPTSGRVYRESTCIRGYTYTCKGGVIQTQSYIEADCITPSGSPYLTNVNQCIQNSHSFSNESASIASCVDSYDIPSNTVLHFDYTGACNAPDWKNNAIDIDYKIIGACQIYPNGGIKFSCNSTYVTMTVYEDPFDYSCSGSKYTDLPIPMSTLNICTSTLNEMNVCNSN